MDGTALADDSGAPPTTPMSPASCVFLSPRHRRPSTVFTTEENEEVDASTFSRVGDEYQCPAIPDALGPQHYATNPHGYPDERPEPTRVANVLDGAHLSENDDDPPSSSKHPHAITPLQARLFSLGLYLFGKDFGAIAKLIEAPSVATVVKHYYDGFKYTIAHRRWREASVRYNIRGEQFVSGRKQGKLLAGLVQRAGLPKAKAATLSDAARRYNEGESNLERFVLEVASIVGRAAFVAEVDVLPSMYAVPPADVASHLAGLPAGSHAQTRFFRAHVWGQLQAHGWQEKEGAKEGGEGACVFLAPHATSPQEGDGIVGVAAMAAHMAKHPDAFAFLEADPACKMHFECQRGPQSSAYPHAKAFAHGAGGYPRHGGGGHGGVHDPSRQPRQYPNSDGKVCENCGTTSTPLWRKDKLNPHVILCNACGIYLKNHGRPRPIADKPGKPDAPAAPPPEAARGVEGAGAAAIKPAPASPAPASPARPKPCVSSPTPSSGASIEEVAEEEVKRIQQGQASTRQSPSRLAKHREREREGEDRSPGIRDGDGACVRDREAANDDDVATDGMKAEAAAEVDRMPLPQWIARKPRGANAGKYPNTSLPYHGGCGGSGSPGKPRFASVEDAARKGIYAAASHLIQMQSDTWHSTKPVRAPKRDRRVASEPKDGGPRHVCANCATTSTPLWRKDMETGRLLCNACGIYKKNHGGVERPVDKAGQYTRAGAVLAAAQRERQAAQAGRPSAGAPSAGRDDPTAPREGKAKRKQPTSSHTVSSLGKRKSARRSRLSPSASALSADSQDAEAEVMSPSGAQQAGDTDAFGFPQSLDAAVVNDPYGAMARQGSALRIDTASPHAIAGF